MILFGRVGLSPDAGELRLDPGWNVQTCGGTSFLEQVIENVVGVISPDLRPFRRSC
jgi:hypothetical protein